MSYATIYQCANDAALVERVTACVAQERDGDTDDATATLMFQIASAADVEAAYASALAGENPDPGGDETVITDGMILSQVQAHAPAAPAEAEPRAADTEQPAA